LENLLSKQNLKATLFSIVLTLNSLFCLWILKMEPESRNSLDEGRVSGILIDSSEMLVRPDHPQPPEDEEELVED
jgi:hypothetical protein